MTNADRWRRAKMFNQGVQVSIELYVPIPRHDRTQPKKAKEKIVKELTVAIRNLENKVKSYDGILHTYQHV